MSNQIPSRPARALRNARSAAAAFLLSASPALAQDTFSSGVNINDGGDATSAKTKLFEVQPSGDAVLTGQLTTGGTTCGGGCDRVFSNGYDLPTIAEHAEQMFARGYLPNVGPTPENAPFNLTDKLGRMLNELEHAHIYIAELEDRTRRIPALEADTAALTARLLRLEAALENLTAAD